MQFIQDCQADDKTENIKKQMHTAKRIYDRLVDEKGFSCGESTISEIVAALKEKHGKVFLPLSFDPGEAEQDICEQLRKRLQSAPVKFSLGLRPHSI